jgi:hypothetical protein
MFLNGGLACSNDHSDRSFLYTIAIARSRTVSRFFTRIFTYFDLASDPSRPYATYKSFVQSYAFHIERKAFL